MYDIYLKVALPSYTIKGIINIGKVFNCIILNIPRDIPIHLEYLHIVDMK